jgi:peroxiredoxin
MRPPLAAALLSLLVVAASPAADLPAAPSWQLTDLDGKVRRLEEWRGKWVLLKLGRTDCPHCAVQWEEFGKAAADFQRTGVTIVDIYMREEKRTLQEYLAKKKLVPEPVILLDRAGDLLPSYRFSVIPHLVLVDPEGRVAWKGGLTQAPELSRVLIAKVSTKT